MKMRKLFHWYSTLLNLIMLVFVAVLLLFIIVLVRNKLLQNSQSLGNALVQSYAVEEEMTIESLLREAALIGQYVDELNTGGDNSEAIHTWLSGHFSKLIRIMGEGIVDFYAVVDGKIVAANPWDGDGTY